MSMPGKGLKESWPIWSVFGWSFGTREAADAGWKLKSEKKLKELSLNENGDGSTLTSKMVNIRSWLSNSKFESRGLFGESDCFIACIPSQASVAEKGDFSKFETRDPHRVVFDSARMGVKDSLIESRC